MPRPQPLALREDAVVKTVREKGRLLEATTTSDTGAVRRPVQIITPGWGSSGYYSAEVLERAADEKIIPAGTHMYLNHASATEASDRPERDVEKIAAVLVEDATWDGSRLIAEAEIMGPHAELIEALAPYIGVSISGSATDIVIGEAEGRRGPIIEGLAHVESVDFVTRAGRGGMVILESARPSLVNARAVGHGVAEATANETREQLQQALRDLLGGEKSWVWVRDFDDTTVWFEHETPEESGTYGLGYEVADDGAVTLSGSPTEVRATTTYVPVTRPDSNTPTTTESLEDNMAKIQIEESEHRGLTEKAGRVDALESENATLKAEKAALEESRAADQRRTRAMDLIREHDHAFSPLEAKGLVAELPLTESGDFDETKFGEQLAEHAATAARAGGAGTVSGFGQTTDTTTKESAPAPTTTAWGRPVSEQKGV